MDNSLYKEIKEIMVDNNEGQHKHPHPDNTGEHFHRGLKGISGRHSHDVEKEDSRKSQHMHIENEVPDGEHKGIGDGQHRHAAEPYNEV